MTQSLRLQGKYYTPADIAKDMAKTGLSLCNAVGLRPTLTIDMACGDGELLFHAAQALLDAGVKASDVAQNLVGVDRDPKAVLQARTRLADLLGTVPRVFHGDALIGRPFGPKNGPVLKEPQFHWTEEVPELEDDWTWPWFIGNPPYMGKVTAAKAFGSPYLKYLQTLHPQPTGKKTHGNTDLCAHFMRRAAALCGNRGTLSFVCTNTISQGDTRQVGLRHLVYDGWKIMNATTDVPWPEEDAAVTVSIAHLVRHPHDEPLDLRW